MSDLNIGKEKSAQSIGNEDYEEDYDYNYIEEDLNEKIITNEANDFLYEDEIIKEREKVINEAMEKLFLQRDEAILAMIYLCWNIDKLDAWYNNADENKIKAGIELSKQTKQKLKENGVESNGENCLVCFEDKNDKFFSLNCGHQFCPECWKEYLKEKIQAPLSALQARCPQEGCTLIVYERLYSKFLNDKKSLEKLDKAIYKNFINRNQDIKQCPNEKCHLYIKSNVHTAQEIYCPCGTSYCFKCLKEPHNPCSCEIYEKFLSINRTNSVEDDNKRWIEANTKECPHCKQKIQRSQGCNYMLCDPKAGGCGHAFCYVCETDWAKHSQDHFNCNKYTDAVKNKEKRAKQIQKELEQDIKKYERYDFYFPRYMNYKSSIEICETTFKETLNEKINLLIVMQNLQVLETKFITDALDALIKAKRTLKNTYIFGYYMKDSQLKKYFEHSQGILEFNTESLHKLLIDEDLNLIIEADNRDYFMSIFQEFKDKVNTKAEIINKYRKSLIDEIENKFIGDLDNYLVDLKL
jgi:ariadne-1